MSPLFFDSQSQTFVIAGVTAVLNTPVTKRISGVYYLTLLSTFDFGISTANFPNTETRPLALITASLAAFGVTPNLSLTSAALTGWTNAYDNINDSWSGTRTINVASVRNCGGNITFTATPQDWVAGTPVSATALAVLLDTYPDNATNGSLSITEDFNGESQRVSSAGIPWNSALFIGVGDLLVHCSEVKRQQIDFTTFLPHNGTTIINPDYSASGAATQYFYRFYTTNGTTRSGGIFTFSGVLEGDLGVGIQIDISLNGIAWYDCCSDYLGGALVNGAGCRTNSGTIVLPNLQITLGSFTTNDASGVVPANSIMFRISMPNTSNVEVGQANFVWA